MTLANDSEASLGEVNNALCAAQRLMAKFSIKIDSIKENEQIYALVLVTPLPVLHKMERLNFKSSKASKLTYSSDFSAIIRGREEGYSCIKTKINRYLLRVIIL